jgi:hypothetical protein
LDLDSVKPDSEHLDPRRCTSFKKNKQLLSLICNLTVFQTTNVKFLFDNFVEKFESDLIAAWLTFKTIFNVENKIMPYYSSSLCYFLWLINSVTGRMYAP